MCVVGSVLCRRALGARMKALEVSMVAVARNLGVDYCAAGPRSALVRRLLFRNALKRNKRVQALKGSGGVTLSRKIARVGQGASMLFGGRVTRFF